jgi:hypothetical protein
MDKKEQEIQRLKKRLNNNGLAAEEKHDELDNQDDTVQAISSAETKKETPVADAVKPEAAPANIEQDAAPTDIKQEMAQTALEPSDATPADIKLENAPAGLEPPAGAVAAAVPERVSPEMAQANLEQDTALAGLTRDLTLADAIPESAPLATAPAKEDLAYTLV